MKEVVQYSIDAEMSKNLNADVIRLILEAAGIVVRGIAWKATWDEDAYDAGKLPKSWD